MARQVGGRSPDGLCEYVKGLDIALRDDPNYGPDTPDEHHEAAAWLVAHHRARTQAPVEAPEETPEPALTPIQTVLEPRLPGDWIDPHVRALAQEPEQVETPQHESDGETGEEANADAVENEADDVRAEPEPHLARDADAGSAGRDEPATGDFVLQSDDPIDADFAVEDFGSEDDLLADEAQDTLAIEGADLETEAAPDGPIAYGASTIDGLVREKLGRVSQIARELKAVQQEGWTVEEYAYLQNLMVRMDRGEAPDDQASRERFLAIAVKSQAMSRIDAVRDRKEGELEDIGQRRDFDAAVYYEPGEGWPQ